MLRVLGVSSPLLPSRAFWLMLPCAALDGGGRA
jgi:hypothetical protein